MEMHIVNDWQDEHVHVMFAGLDITFPWYIPVHKLQQLFAFMFDSVDRIVITTGNKYSGANSKEYIKEDFSWSLFTKIADSALTNRYYIETLFANEELFKELSYNPVIKRDSIIVSNTNCLSIAIYIVSGSVVILRPLNNWATGVRADVSTTVDCGNVHILLKRTHVGAEEYFYFPQSIVTTANLCGLSYVTMFEHQGMKLC